jgi:hypothetical protein
MFKPNLGQYTHFLLMSALFHPSIDSIDISKSYNFVLEKSENLGENDRKI